VASSFIQDAPALALAPRLEAALRRLDGLVDWERRARISARGPRMRVTVDPARDLLQRLGRPQRTFLPLHVAGTKGKGSVALLAAAGLQRLGFGVGVYASPHVERVTERVRIGLAEVADDALARSLEAVFGAREEALAAESPGREATWFDVLTAAAFHALAAVRTEVAVIECGLGGRLDSTNVLSAPVCVITNVELEHTDILGSTRAAIAREKAGIIAEGASVVTSLSPEHGDEAGRVVAEVAAARGARLVVCAASGGTIEERNAALARAALDELGRRCADRLPAPRDLPPGGWGDVLDGPTRARGRLPGRGERRRAGSTPVILDGAHVKESLSMLLDELEAAAGLGPRPIVVFGVGQEKDSRGLLKALVPRVDSLVCTTVGDGPYRSAEELAADVRGLGGEARARPDPRGALHEALRLAGSGGWVLVTGSLHLIGAVRRFTEDP